MRTFSEAVRLLNTLQANHATLESLKRAGARLNLRSLPEMRVYLSRLGYSQGDLDRLNVIHVTGTKGKGSTCAFTESVLRAHGVRTGLYTSPHLVSVRERIMLAGRPVETEKFVRYFFETWDRIQPPGGAFAAPFLSGSNGGAPYAVSSDDAPPLPSYFRFLTLLCFHIFLQEQVDVAILEVGIGGAYDATNVIDRPVVCGITSIGIDHTDVLGDTVESIAWHKAGIIKAGVPCYVSPQSDAVMRVIREQAAARTPPAPLEMASDPCKHPLGLHGPHQPGNAALAVALASYWMKQRGGGRHVDEEKVRVGLGQTVWPGRCHVVRAGERAYYLDGAHTLESITSSVEWFGSTRASAERRPVTLIFNCTHDRRPDRLLGPIMDHVDSWNVTQVIFCPNAAGPTARRTDETLDISLPSGLDTQEEMRRIWTARVPHVPAVVCGSVDAALAAVQEGPRDVFVTGSLLLCGVVIGALVDSHGIDPFAPPKQA